LEKKKGQEIGIGKQKKPNPSSQLSPRSAAARFSLLSMRPTLPRGPAPSSARGQLSPPHAAHTCAPAQAYTRCTAPSLPRMEKRPRAQPCMPRPLLASRPTQRHHQSYFLQRWALFLSRSLLLYNAGPRPPVYLRPCREPCTSLAAHVPGNARRQADRRRPGSRKQHRNWSRALRVPRPPCSSPFQVALLPAQT
jgi:hypothetical protein